MKSTMERVFVFTEKVAEKSSQNPNKDQSANGFPEQVFVFGEMVTNFDDVTKWHKAQNTKDENTLEWFPTSVTIQKSASQYYFLFQLRVIDVNQFFNETFRYRPSFSFKIPLVMMYVKS